MLDKMIPPPNRYPNLFLVGTPKAGSTTLSSYLNFHPDIFCSSFKEPQFFSQKNNLSLHDYLNIFSGWQGEAYGLDGSIQYCIDPTVAEKIYTVCPDAYFIFTVRNPIDRAYSRHIYNSQFSAELTGYRTSFLNSMDDKRAPNWLDGPPREGSLYYHSLYTQNIKRFIDVFGYDRVKIMIFERWSHDPVKEINECFQFLRLPILSALPERHLNTSRVVNPRLFTCYRRCLQFWMAFNRTLGGELLKKVGVPRFFKYLFLKRPDVLNKDDRDWTRHFFQKDVHDFRCLVNDDIPEWNADFPIAKP